MDITVLLLLLQGGRGGRVEAAVRREAAAWERRLA